MALVADWPSLGEHFGLDLAGGAIMQHELVAFKVRLGHLVAGLTDHLRSCVITPAASSLTAQFPIPNCLTTGTHDHVIGRVGHLLGGRTAC